MISEKNKQIARFLCSVFKNTPTITRVYDQAKTAFLDVAVAKDFPDPGLTCFSTLGMSDVIIHGERNEALDFRMEIIACSSNGSGVFPDVLYEVYKHAAQNPEWNCTPGSVLQHVMTPWNEHSMMKHAYFTSSFFVEELNKVHEFDGMKTIWVMMIPISQQELDYLEAHGDDAFETLLESAGADFLDLHRASVL